MLLSSNSSAVLHSFSWRQERTVTTCPGSKPKQSTARSWDSGVMCWCVRNPRVLLPVFSPRSPALPRTALSADVCHGSDVISIEQAGDDDRDPSRHDPPRTLRWGLCLAGTSLPLLCVHWLTTQALSSLLHLPADCRRSGACVGDEARPRAGRPLSALCSHGSRVCRCTVRNRVKQASITVEGQS